PATSMASRKARFNVPAGTGAAGVGGLVLVLAVAGGVAASLPPGAGAVGVGAGAGAAGGNSVLKSNRSAVRSNTTCGSLSRVAFTRKSSLLLLRTALISLVS